jgi:aminopeptidase YwaD
MEIHEKAQIANQVMKHARRLAEEIGCRFAGSPGCRTAENYIQTIFEQAGLVVERMEYPWPDWSEESTRLEVEGQALEALANPFSPACDVTGQIIAVGTPAEMEAADFTGRIALFYGSLAQEPWVIKHCFYLPEELCQFPFQVEAKHPAAVLVINPTPGDRWRMVEDTEFLLPSATVTAETGLDLLSQVGRTAHLCINTHTQPGISADIIARLPGTRPGRIILCAHHDTKVDTPGAWDNASGAAVLLTLAERLSGRPRGISLEFVSFTGEEYFTGHELDYINRFESTFGSVLAAINLDGVGHKLMTHTLSAYSASPQFEEHIFQAAARFPGVTRTDPWPQSNHSLFAMRGVPSLAVSNFVNSGTILKGIAHTPYDSLRWLSPHQLAEAVELVETLIAVLADKDPAWCRPAPEMQSA